MAMPERRPLAPMESRDERLTVRLTLTERTEWDAAARRAGEETSRYFRRMATIGRRLDDAGALREATRG